jgi:hypothetical protein
LYIIPAASIGVALLPVSTAATVAGLVLSAASISGSTYYAATGKDPVYAAASSVASAADALFVPAFQAFQATFVSPETFPASAAQYVGVESSVGASVGDILEHVENSDTEDFPELKNLISANTSQTVPTIPSSINPFSITGLVLSQAGNNYAQVSGGAWVQNTSGYAEQQYTVFLSLISPSSTILHGTYKEQPAYLALSPGKQIIMYSVGVYSVANGAAGFRQTHIYNIACIATSLAETYPAPDGAVNYDTLKQALSNPSAAVSAELKEAVKDMPDDKKVVSSNPSPSSVPAPSQTAITNEQVNNFFTQNTSNVFNEYNNVANNASSTYNDIEGAKAAAELAKEQEEAEKEKEPSYPVPQNWYTPNCDLSKVSLSTCINYQQVLSSTEEFRGTPLYQIPNLVLDCLGYVEGDGCQYPPLLNFDLLARFSSEPVKIDLSPFEPVVKVMKFFFSLICLVGTGKLIMNLFE